MIFLKKNGDRLKRWLCLMIATAITLSLIPPPASAADDSIKLTSCDFTSISYHSEALGNASIHTIEFDYKGGMTGFCGDHGKKWDAPSSGRRGATGRKARSSEIRTGNDNRIINQP